MKLDIRFPLGLMFITFGLMLLAFGLISNPSIHSRSLGININVYIGSAQFLFGTAVLDVATRRNLR